MVKKLPWLIMITLLFLSVSCTPKGERGGACLEERTCASPDLVCGADNICETCGKQGWSCCDQGSQCEDELICDSDNICTTCGTKYDPPCADGSCIGDLVVGSNGECRECGDLLDPCCPVSQCNAGFACNNKGTCEFCGGPDQLCCPGDSPTCDNSVCGKNSRCVATVCDASGNCQSCGWSSAPCCEGGLCEADSICNAEGMCERCGGYIEPVCKDGTCGGYMEPYEGWCLVPSQVNISACEELEPGHDHRNTRDWCFWYAAYQQQDTTLCSRIAWHLMITPCEQGENPDDYLLW